MLFIRRISLFVFLTFTLFGLQVSAFAQTTFKRVEQSLTQLKPVEKSSGGWEVTENVTINGRVFKEAIAMDGWGLTRRGGKRENVVIANNGNYELFEAWIGKRGGSGRGTIQFTVLGDGTELYKSPRMSMDDAALRVSVSIKTYSGITLKCEGDENIGRTWSMIWAEPVFVKLVPDVPTPPPSFNPPSVVGSDFPTGQVSQGQIAVLLNGQPIRFSNAPATRIGGRIMVPMRDIFEALGASVRWNAATQAIIANRGQTAVNMQIGNFGAVVNGRNVRLDQPPILYSGSTMVPLRFVSEALGAQVSWNEYERAVTVTAPQ